IKALDSASDGPVAEGTVGAGTGMVAFGFKGGIGTSSRIVQAAGDYTVGVLVNANFGRREELVMGGVPVGQLYGAGAASAPGPDGSVIIIIATDAPLDARQ